MQRVRMPSAAWRGRSTRIDVLETDLLSNWIYGRMSSTRFVRGDATRSYNGFQRLGRLP